MYMKWDVVEQGSLITYFLLSKVQLEDKLYRFTLCSP